MVHQNLDGDSELGYYNEELAEIIHNLANGRIPEAKVDRLSVNEYKGVLTYLKAIRRLYATYDKIRKDGKIVKTETVAQENGYQYEDERQDNSFEVWNHYRFLNPYDYLIRAIDSYKDGFGKYVMTHTRRREKEYAFRKKVSDIFATH